MPIRVDGRGSECGGGGSVNLLWFMNGRLPDGIVGGGGTDTTAAWQRAYDWIAANGGPRTLDVPYAGTGVYRVDGSIAIGPQHSNITTRIAPGVMIDDSVGAVSGSGVTFNILGSIGSEVNLSAPIDRGASSFTTVSAHGVPLNGFALLKSSIDCLSTQTQASVWEAADVLRWRTGTPTGSQQVSFGQCVQARDVPASTTLGIEGYAYFKYPIVQIGTTARTCSTVAKLTFVENFIIEGGEFVRSQPTFVSTGRDLISMRYARNCGVRRAIFSLGDFTGAAVRLQQCLESFVEDLVIRRPASWAFPSGAAYNELKYIGTWSCHAYRVRLYNTAQGLDNTFTSGGNINLFTEVVDYYVEGCKQDGITDHSGSYGSIFRGLTMRNCRWSANFRQRFTTVENLDALATNNTDSADGMVAFGSVSADTVIRNLTLRGGHTGLKIWSTIAEAGFPRDRKIMVDGLYVSDCVRAFEAGTLDNVWEAATSGSITVRNFDFENISDYGGYVGAYQNGIAFEGGRIGPMTGTAPVGLFWEDNAAMPIAKSVTFDNLGAAATGIRTGILSDTAVFSGWASLKGDIRSLTFLGVIGRRTSYDASPIDQMLGGPTGINLLRNPLMRTAQRGTSFSGLGANAVDRLPADGMELATNSAAPARWTGTQETGGGVGSGECWTKLLLTTADTVVASADSQMLRQSIEAQYVRDLVGPDNRFAGAVFRFDILLHKDAASSMVFPFKLAVLARITGGSERQLARNITIPAADTWYSCAVYLPPDASGIITSNTDAGFAIGLTLYSEGAANPGDVWTTTATGNVRQTGGTNRLVDATGNYLGTTRWKLEPGEIETTFRFASNEAIADDVLNQRYLVVLDAALATGAEVAEAYRGADSTTVATFKVPTRMRPGAAPSITVTAAEWEAYDGAAGTDLTALAVSATSLPGGDTVLTGTVASGLTQFRPYNLREDGTDGGKIILSRELPAPP